MLALMDERAAAAAAAAAARDAAHDRASSSSPPDAPPAAIITEETALQLLDAINNLTAVMQNQNAGIEGFVLDENHHGDGHLGVVRGGEAGEPGVHATVGVVELRGPGLAGDAVAGDLGPGPQMVPYGPYGMVWPYSVLFRLA